MVAETAEPKFEFERFVPRKRVKAVSADVLLEAIVMAIRDGATNGRLNDIIKCYPRILNKANPYTVLIDEIVRLRAICAGHEETILRLTKLIDERKQ